MDETDSRIAELERQVYQLQQANTRYALEKQARWGLLSEFRINEIEVAVRKAQSRPAFADLNHVYGVLAEEMAELLDEVRRNHAPRARLELYDIAGATLKAILAIEGQRL